MVELKQIVVTGVKTIDVTHAIHLYADEDFARESNLSYEQLKKYDNWLYVHGGIYYLKDKKDLTVKGLASELLGVELSKYMGLPTIEYDLATRNGELVGLLSKNYRNKDAVYIDARYLSRDDLQYIRKTLLDSEFSQDYELKRNLAAYLARNFYAEQQDRRYNVSIIKSIDKPIKLAPLYDYEHSFNGGEERKYINDPLTGDINFRELKHLYETNEYFKEYIDKLSDLDLLALFRQAEDKIDLDIEDVRLSRDFTVGILFKIFQDNRKKVLNDIKRK